MGGCLRAALAGKSGKEILFSRFLAGIIDLVLAGAAGLAFAFAAARLLGVHFPTPEFLLLAAGCGFSVFFLDSVFFPRSRSANSRDDVDLHQGGSYPR